MAAVADSWEEMDDKLVEEQIKKLNISSERKSSQPHDGPVTVILRDDDCRTQYRPDGPPQVRILKRTDQSGTNGVGGQKRPQSVAKPSKTYEERHAEYQEARMRIMGRAEDPDPDDGSSSSSSPRITIPLHMSRSSPALTSHNSQPLLPSAVTVVANNSPGAPRPPLSSAPSQQPPTPPGPSLMFRPPDHMAPPPPLPLFFPQPHLHHQHHLAQQIVMLPQGQMRPQKPGYLLPTPPLLQAKQELVMQIPRNGGRVSLLRPGESWPSGSVDPASRPVPLVRSPKGPDGSQGFRAGR